MRFTKEKKLIDAYFNNTKELKQKFLWFPLTIDGETRWLEEATILYRVKREDTLFFGKHYYWHPWEFVDNED